MTMPPSLFIQVRTGTKPAETYRQAIEAAVAAERLGFGTIWFATRHFAAHHAALPTVFPLLAAVAQHTSRIRLGSGVVALPFENPVRLVEDAAVTDELSGGRLELGVGKGLGFGLSATTYAGFGLAQDDRESLYASRLATLHSLLEEGTVAPGIPIHPDPTSLRHRVWQSTGNTRTARRVARAGDGLLPHPNSEAGKDGDAHRLVDAYLADLGSGVPRIGSTVALVPGGTDDDARAIFDADVTLSPDYYGGKLGGGADAYRRGLSIHCASADRLVAEILGSPVPAATTDWLFHVPLALHHPRYTECLERIATDIVPHLRSLEPAHS
ncbi:LLM class flavin-dependent oxidoreductase [Gordonia sp. ABSL11-1]|uniref:LLM class flavin-dependent oxidoreductase n=1 Tax=Gordonia sp. ABSL11-1 TaxID=3053924 RepID=UPI002573B63E|nr:LLM class flavin-dependent oxidoreductase [Gordonia sp. ABSL11-1]MDL9947932.1 LLM class flavin-dependent oxidoreductase [Gordonia sp. ABSL11-1]